MLPIPPNNTQLNQSFSDNTIQFNGQLEESNKTFQIKEISESTKEKLVTEVSKNCLPENQQTSITKFITREIIKKSYQDGSSYEGEGDQNGANGFGKISFTNGDYIEGEFLDNEFKKGNMKRTYSNGSFYEGEGDKNGPTGFGKFCNSGGEYTEGVFKYQSMPVHAKHKKIYPDGSVYEGEIYRGKRHGQGTYIFPNGDYIKGNFLAGDFMVHGEVRKTFKNGSIYDGSSVWGDYAVGKKTFPNGDYFKGDFKDNKPWNGIGRKTYKSGDVFEGEFFEGKAKFSNITKVTKQTPEQSKTKIKESEDAVDD